IMHSRCRPRRDLLSFPTRRSSDLYTAAKELGLEVGDQFTGAHGTVAGFDHEEHHSDESAHEPHDTHHSFIYTVVGILPQLSNSEDRKSTRLNSSHVKISYAVFCLK